MSSRRKRPCCICHHWFLPDTRVGSRQHTCAARVASSSGAARCRAAWRARNPELLCRAPDFRHGLCLIRPRRRPPSQGGLLRQRHQRRPPCLRPPPSPPTSSRPPAPLRLRAPLNQLPWDIAQSEFGPQGADFIGIMAGLLLHETQSEIAAYRVEITAVTERLRPPGAQSQIPPGAYLSGSGGEAESDATGIPST